MCLRDQRTIFPYEACGGACYHPRRDRATSRSAYRNEARSGNTVATCVRPAVKLVDKLRKLFYAMQRQLIRGQECPRMNHKVAKMRAYQIRSGVNLVRNGTARWAADVY